jgi:hypothetical protein
MLRYRGFFHFTDNIPELKMKEKTVNKGGSISPVLTRILWPFPFSSAPD